MLENGRLSQDGGGNGQMPSREGIQKPLAKEGEDEDGPRMESGGVAEFKGVLEQQATFDKNLYGCWGHVEMSP